MIDDNKAQEAVDAIENALISFQNAVLHAKNIGLQVFVADHSGQNISTDKIKFHAKYEKRYR